MFPTTYQWLILIKKRKQILFETDLSPQIAWLIMLLYDTLYFVYVNWGYTKWSRSLKSCTLAIVPIQLIGRYPHLLRYSHLQSATYIVQMEPTNQKWSQ